MTTRIGFIGTGHIAAPMVRFLAARGHRVTVSERNAQIAAELKVSHGATVASNQSVIDQSDVVFLCVRPHIADEVFAGLTFRADQQIVSVMAGVSFARLEGFCAPAKAITMTIPLGYLEHGGCPLPAYPDAVVLEPLFGPENPVFDVVSEQALNQHFAICAFVPGVLDLMVTAAQWLGDATGDRDASERYTLQLVNGFLSALAEGRAGQLVAERDALATQGTISLMMTETLHREGAHAALKDALDGIGKRLTPGADDKPAA